MDQITDQVPDQTQAQPHGSGFKKWFCKADAGLLAFAALALGVLIFLIVHAFVSGSLFIS